MEEVVFVHIGERKITVTLHYDALSCTEVNRFS